MDREIRGSRRRCPHQAAAVPTRWAGSCRWPGALGRARSHGERDKGPEGVAGVRIWEGTAEEGQVQGERQRVPKAPFLGTRQATGAGLSLQG